MGQTITSVVAILAPLGLVFGVLYIHFTTRNRERMALIEKGADASLFYGDKKGQTNYILKFALLAIGIGLGSFMGYVLDMFAGMGEGPAYTSMIFIFGGVGLLLSYLIESKKQSKESE